MQVLIKKFDDIVNIEKFISKEQLWIALEPKPSAVVAIGGHLDMEAFCNFLMQENYEFEVKILNHEN